MGIENRKGSFMFFFPICWRREDVTVESDESNQLGFSQNTGLRLMRL